MGLAPLSKRFSHHQYYIHDVQGISQGGYPRTQQVESINTVARQPNNGTDSFHTEKKCTKEVCPWSGEEFNGAGGTERPRAKLVPR